MSQDFLQCVMFGQLATKCPCFMETEGSLPCPHRALLSDLRIHCQSIPSHPTSVRSTLILSYDLSLDVPNDFPPSRYHKENEYDTVSSFVNKWDSLVVYLAMLTISRPSVQPILERTSGIIVGWFEDRACQKHNKWHI
jgi:hypothetical protein